MVSQIFINLPVADLKRSIAFFTALEFRFEEKWSDATTTCMVVAPTICVMLIQRERFQGFTPRAVADAHHGTEVLLSIALESREAVNTLVARALRQGATVWKTAEDHGFMYAHAFADLDGHIWEPLHFTPATPEA
ncbi:MAG: glyoxalase/bleomycin resistance/extradiol dioxygenase family protein [Candidatus Dactylopiibacterium sp.]|nr:glyoxalase/bleomycin resistance/extradiol dioxygenase family protein [Candidatus Dactylopiibacterium sp.]